MRRPICEFALGYPEFRQKSVHATTTGSSEAVLRFAAMLYGFSPRGIALAKFPLRHPQPPRTDRILRVVGIAQLPNRLSSSDHEK